MKTVLNVVCALAATLGSMVASAGCTDYDSETDLNPAGPPMVEQVRLKETYLQTPTSTSTSERRVFAFGSHPMAEEVDAHPVTSATATGNGFRVIMDELLVGNNLEEIACRAPVDADSFARVPRGATPDDIARCSSAQDVLPRTCTGGFSVCLCELDTGCTVGTLCDPNNPAIALCAVGTACVSGQCIIPRGGPVGVLDINQDGAADESRMIDGAVGVKCGAIDVPMDLDASYWNPSGNQQVPAMGGFEALGPAIVLLPLRGLPTNLECELAFGPEVVDKQGNAPCTPSGGDITAACQPGDTSGFKFRVEPMSFENDPPAMSTGVNRMSPVTLLANTELDLTSINATNITISPTPPGAISFTIMMNKTVTMAFAAPGLAATTLYTVTVTTAVKDSFGQALPAPHVFTFTTAN